MVTSEIRSFFAAKIDVVSVAGIGAGRLTKKYRRDDFFLIHSDIKIPGIIIFLRKLSFEFIFCVYKCPNLYSLDII